MSSLQLLQEARKVKVAKDTIKIYIKTCFELNTNRGSYGIAIVDGENTKFYSGREDDYMTCNRIILYAALTALKKIRHDSKIDIYSDSQYLINGINKWIKAWKKRGWKKRDGSKVVNRSLWSSLDKEIKKHSVRGRWIEQDTRNEMMRICKGMAEIAMHF